MPTGTVKWFKKQVGWGFLCSDEVTGDILVHYSEILGEEPYKVLENGESVEFDVQKNADGRLRALNVKRLSRPTQSQSNLPERNHKRFMPRPRPRQFRR